MRKILNFKSFLNESLGQTSALKTVLKYILETEKQHYENSKSEDHIFKNYLNCKDVNFDKHKCYEDIAKIIEYLEYDNCKDFYESEMPKNHIYRNIKKLRSEMYKDVKDFKKVYEPNLWNLEEDVLEEQPEELN
jgi:hypothetical protein